MNFCRDCTHRDDYYRCRHPIIGRLPLTGDTLATGSFKYKNCMDIRFEQSVRYNEDTDDDELVGSLNCPHFQERPLTRWQRFVEWLNQSISRW